MKKILTLILFVIPLFERVVFDLGPNIELITASMLAASAFLGVKRSLILTLLIMFISDLIIGNTNIFIFTWSGFLLPVFLSGKIFARIKSKKILLSLPLGLSSTLFFYIWTNFGVWLLDSWGMYSKDMNGLLMSYINGLPFLKYQLITNLIFVPLMFIFIKIVRVILLSKSPLSNLAHN